jgi:hypothetical protein
MNLESIVSNILKTIPARRGQLFEQYFTRMGKDGKEKKVGPYFVLTRSVNGKTMSERIKREDAPQVREELARGRTLASLIEKLWEMAEESTKGGRKKNSSAKSKEPHRNLSQKH